MSHLAVNLSMIFTEVPVIERFALAHAHGFEHVEGFVLRDSNNFMFKIFNIYHDSTSFYLVSIIAYFPKTVSNSELCRFFHKNLSNIKIFLNILHFLLYI